MLLFYINGDVFENVDSFRESFSLACARRKSFSFFHHYPSLFLISDTNWLTASKIDGVIDW